MSSFLHKKARKKNLFKIRWIRHCWISIFLFCSEIHLKFKLKIREKKIRQYSIVVVVIGIESNEFITWWGHGFVVFYISILNTAVSLEKSYTIWQKKKIGWMLVKQEEIHSKKKLRKKLGIRFKNPNNQFSQPNIRASIMSIRKVPFEWFYKHREEDTVDWTRNRRKEKKKHEKTEEERRKKKD